MEPSSPPQSLSIESFSYSWLVNLKPSSLDHNNNNNLNLNDESSSYFIEMDPRLTPSKRFFKISQDSNFDFPISQQSPINLVHADEIFSNGYIINRCAKMDKIEVEDTVEEVANNIPRTSFSLKKYRRISRRMLAKYLDFLMPLYRRIRGRKSRNGKEIVVKNKSKVCSAETSPCRMSVASNYSADNWRMSCDSETSIYEAVLHCKKSLGK